MISNFNFLEDVQHSFQDSTPKEKAFYRTYREKLQAAVTELLSVAECAKDKEHAIEAVDDVVNYINGKIVKLRAERIQDGNEKENINSCPNR
jgi:hypothetical protein